MYNILICDDDKNIVDALEIYLKCDEYILYKAYNGEEALEIIKNENIHLVILDIMMPVMNGMVALSEIRAISNVPVILLTAKNLDTDKILGLNLGADDYITKPFNPIEIAARVNSQLRRYTKLGSSIQETHQFEAGDILLDDMKKMVQVAGETVSLTKTEYDILKFLISHPNQVFSVSEIYKNVWKEELIGSKRIVSVHIRHLREKIEIDPGNPRYIKVVFGQGYMFERN